MSSKHGALQTFDSWDNWESYSKRLEQYFVSNCVPNDEQVAVLLAVLSPRVFRVLRESCHPDLPRLKTYGELSNLLETRHSSEAYNSSEVLTKRVEFFQATQTDEESLKEWLSKIMSLAADCEFDDQLESMLINNFVSGLANREIMRKLCQEMDKATLRHIVFLAEKLEAQISEKSLASEQKGPQSIKKKISCSVLNILDLPVEILRKIILHLDARVRVRLGNCCERFNQLVFNDSVLLRNLDFSKKAYLTSETDILPYFEDKSTWKQIRKINLRNVVCLEPGSMMNYSIGKANTLVDINVHGIKFKDFQQLGHFLKPLIHIKRLSVDLPNMKEEDIPLVHEVLQQPLKRFTYLSLEIIMVPWSREFTRLLQLCESLREVLITKIWSNDDPPAHIWNVEPKDLRNLEIVNYRGPYAQQFKDHFVTLLPDPEKWTEFPITSYFTFCRGGFYLEKDVKVCKELVGKKITQSAPKHEWHHFNLGSVLVPELLIKEVLKITHENVPEEFCCLSRLRQARANVLKFEETKRLLKNPRYAISYLCINNPIEPDCDVHLVASAFPNLTELILPTVTINHERTTTNRHHKRMLRRRFSALPEKEDDSKNMNSSFQMLVKNTPHLKRVTLRIPKNSNGDWNLSTLDLMSGWQSLQFLHLVLEVPQDHRFCSKDEVLEENFCKNLISSTRRLIHQCCQLTELEFVAALEFEPNFIMLAEVLEGLDLEEIRPDLQVDVSLPPGSWEFRDTEEYNSNMNEAVDGFESMLKSFPTHAYGNLYIFNDRGMLCSYQCVCLLQAGHLISYKIE